MKTYAEKQRIPVEECKPRSERGTYLHRDAYGENSSRKDVKAIRRAL